MYTQQTGTNKDPSPKVKNTFLEYSIPEENDAPPMGQKRRTRSDVADIAHSPLVVASKSPICSPLLQPLDETMQAVPIEEVNFELLEEAEEGGEPSASSRTRYPDGTEAVAQATAGLGRDEPAYVMPTTPSPFLHSAFPPSVVPPFGAYGYGMPDMGLPPAFGAEGDEPQGGGDGMYGVHGNQDMMQDVDGQYMQGMQYLPDMYDPNFGGYMPYGWAAIPVEGDGGYGTGSQQQQGGPEQCGAVAAPQPGPSPPDGLTPGSPRDQALPVVGDEPRELLERTGAKEGGRRGKGRNREARDEERDERRMAKAAAGGGSGGAGAGGNAGGGGSGGNASGGGASGGGGGGGRGRAETSGGREQAERKDSDPGDPGTPGVYTTVMLRNIPNKYTREMLIKQLGVDFQGQFDFMYLPIDFKNKCNVGYGFINFRTPEACDLFMKQFHGVDVRKCLPGLNSKKVVEVTPARVQGLSENVRRLRNSPVMNQLQDHPEWMPLLFNDDGYEEPFPMPDQPLPPVKPRGRNREAHGAQALGDA